MNLAAIPKTMEAISQAIAAVTKARLSGLDEADVLAAAQKIIVVAYIADAALANVIPEATALAIVTAADGLFNLVHPLVVAPPAANPNPTAKAGYLPTIAANIGTVAGQVAAVAATLPQGNTTAAIESVASVVEAVAATPTPTTVDQAAGEVVAVAASLPQGNTTAAVEQVATEVAAVADSVGQNSAASDAANEL